ncbi:MAG: ROK family protein [Pyrinomonadaceae bacterium]
MNSAIRAVMPGGDCHPELSSSVQFDREEDPIAQISEFVAAFEAKTGGFNAFGLAVPGLVDIRENRIVYAPRQPKLENSDLAAALGEATGKKVFLENDANAAAYSELKCGSAGGSENFFYLTVGSGVGGALVLGGEIWHGVSGFAGEFGFISIDSDGRHLEDVASADGIVARAKRRLHQDPASTLFEVGEENLTFEDILSAAIKEDGLAELMLERTGMFIGNAVAGVINLLNIEKIIVGGEILRAGDIVVDAIRSRASELSFEPAFRAVSIESAKLGEDAAANGAALLAAFRHGN